MSSSIWTRCAGDSELRPLRLEPLRAVEAQHQISTRKLVDSLEEQILLETMLDAAKPPDPTAGRLHYLLSTPFRYPPLRRGSRFGGRHERGIWYGSLSNRAVFSEVAYYRFVFLAGTRADLGTVTTQLTVFRVRAGTGRGVHLVAPPFAEHRDTIASRAGYAETQALGGAMRAAGVEMFVYPSARDPDGGMNVGVFTPTVFGNAQPRGLETWQCTATPARVELLKRNHFEPATFAFARETFLVDGDLPAPAV